MLACTGIWSSWDIWVWKTEHASLRCYVIITTYTHEFTYIIISHLLIICLHAQVYDLFEIYESEKRSMQAYDVSDVMYYIWTQLQSRPYNGTPIHAMFVDETQDFTQVKKDKCLCACVCIYTCMHACIHTPIHAMFVDETQDFTQAKKDKCLCACVCIYTCMHAYTHRTSPR